jgi:hypothetical protein
MKEKKNKKKKEKVVYYDDGRTIADMSNVGGRPKLETDDKNFVRPRSTIKEVLKTYFGAVKSMLIPMFVTLGALTIVFFLAFLLLGGFN